VVVTINTPVRRRRASAAPSTSINEPPAPIGKAAGHRPYDKYWHRTGGQIKISSVKTDDQTHFAISVSCHGKVLAPGASCSLTVTFTASENKTFKAKLLVYDDAPGSPHDVPLTGYRGPLIIIHFP
jgi:hypothetical protein